MWREMYSWLCNENIPLAVIFCCSVFLLTVAFFIAYGFRSLGVYTALTIVLFGVYLLTVSIYGGIRVANRCTAVLFICAGSLYLILRTVLALKAKIKTRRERRLKTERQLQFTLPEKDNSFIRARLNTVLKSENEQETVQEPQAIDFRLGYAKQLLMKLKEQKLSTADSLKREEFSALIGAYANKLQCTASDLRTLNDALAGLLKLSAKYAV